MYRCDESEADIVVDEQFFRLDTLAELRHFEKLASRLRGVRFLHQGATALRLEREQAAWLTEQQQGA